MNKRNVTLFFLAIVIVFVARQITSFQLLRTVEPVRSSSGEIYIGVEMLDSRSVIFRESRTTGETRMISQLHAEIEKIVLCEPLNQIIVIDSFSIQSLTPFVRNNAKWRLRHRLLSVFQAAIVPGTDCLLVVGENLDQLKSDGRECVRLFDLSDGSLVHEFFGSEIRRVVVNHRQAHCESEHRARSLSWVGDDNREIELAERPLGSQSISSRAESASVIWDAGRTTSRAQIWSFIPKRRSFWFLAAMGITVAMLFWSYLLIGESPKSSSADTSFLWHGIRCLLTLLVMLYLIGVPIGTPMFQASGAEIRESFPRYIFLGLTQSVGFLLLMNIRNARQVWIAALATCMIPFLLPVMLLVVFLRRDEISAYRKTHSGRFFRFGIAEMLLGTLGIAVFMQFGILPLQLYALSIPLMIHILISYLFARKIEFAWGIAITSLALVTWILAAQLAVTNTQIPFSNAIYLLIVPLCFSVLGIFRQFEKPLAL